MGTKSANVMARVEPDIKDRAESIFNQLGLSSSAAINMFYRQVIFWHGIPFRPTIPMEQPPVLSELSKEAFDERMSAGLAQAKANQSLDIDDAFSSLIGRIKNG